MSVSDMYRWCARVGSTVLIVSWLALFIAETMQHGLDGPELNTYGQAAALAIVFAGYVIGWWKETAGGVMAIVGTVGLFALVALTQDAPLGAAAIWFAVPGLLYLLANSYSRKA